MKAIHQVEIVEKVRVGSRQSREVERGNPTSMDGTEEDLSQDEEQASILE